MGFTEEKPYYEFNGQQYELTPEKQREVIDYINQAFDEGYALGHYDVWEKCINAILMRFSKKVGEKDSWMKDYAPYVPVLRQMASILSSSISQMIFPNDDNYLLIEGDDLASRFLTEVILHNAHKTAWIQNADRNIYQTVSLGNSWLAVQPRGKYIEAVPIGLDTMVVTPLSDDLSNSTKINLLRKRLDELIESSFQYFNLEELYKNSSKGLSRTRVTQIDRRQKENNTLSRGKKLTLGEGFLIYQSFIHFFQFKDGTHIKNYVASYVDEPRTLIRFEPQYPGFDPFILTRYGTILPNQFWAQGPIEQGLSISNYLNSLMMVSLVQDVLDAIGVYVYNVNDEALNSAVNKNELIIAPNRMWGADNVNNIQPLQRAARTGNVKELFFILKNELVDLVNAHVFFSGNTPDGKADPTATFTNARQNGASMRVQSVGKIFDEGMTKPYVYRVLQLLQRSWMGKGQIINPQTGQPINVEQPNEEVIREWLRDIGWDEDTITEPGFLEGIMEPVEKSRIKVTGTQTLAKKIQSQDNMTLVVDRINASPMFQPIIRPEKLLKEYLKVNDIQNMDEIIIDPEEQIQQYEQMLMQIDQVLSDPNGINPQTGQPLQEKDVNDLLQDKQEIEARLSEFRMSNQNDGVPYEEAMQPQPTDESTGKDVAPTETRGLTEYVG
jgi:hypothetical protein